MQAQLNKYHNSLKKCLPRFVNCHNLDLYNNYTHNEVKYNLLPMIALNWSNLKIPVIKPVIYIIPSHFHNKTDKQD
jgi:hypothetical protein